MFLHGGKLHLSHFPTLRLLAVLYFVKPPSRTPHSNGCVLVQATDLFVSKMERPVAWMEISFPRFSVIAGTSSVHARSVTCAATCRGWTRAGPTIKLPLRDCVSAFEQELVLVLVVDNEAQLQIAELRGTQGSHSDST